jgi:hypothetical protein
MFSDSCLPETLAINAETEPTIKTARVRKSYLLNLFQTKDKTTNTTAKGNDTTVR